MKRFSSLLKMFPEIVNNIPPSFYSGLNEINPTRCSVEFYKAGRAKIQIAVLDISGALLVVTGLFTSFKLNIRRGSVLRKKALKVIVALFDVSFDVENPFDDAKQALFKAELNSLWSILKADRNEVVQKLLLQTLQTPQKIESYPSKLRTLKLSVGSSDEEPEMQFLSDDSEGAVSSSYSHSDSGMDNDTFTAEVSTIPCSVKAEDTIGFLFFLSTALTLRDLDIDGIVVDGDEVHVNDLFFLSPNQFHEQSYTPVESSTWTIKDEIQTAVAVLQSFTQVLSLAPDPSQALRNFDRLLSSLERNSMIGEVQQMMHEQTLKRLALILGSSSFLWEGFLQNSYVENVDVLRDDLKTLESEIVTTEEYENKFASRVPLSILDLDATQSLQRLSETISRFKSQELFRIYIKQLLCPNISFFSRDLNSLAEALLRYCIKIAQKWLERFGSKLAQYWPLNVHGDPCRAAICGLGKFGGCEMGFASDCKFIVVYFLLTMI